MPNMLQGLRTLVLGTKIIPEREYAEWDSRYQEAASSFADRDAKLDALGVEVCHWAAGGAAGGLLAATRWLLRLMPHHATHASTGCSYRWSATWSWWA